MNDNTQYHGINVAAQGSGPFASLYSPTVGLRRLAFGSANDSPFSSERVPICKSAESLIRRSSEYSSWVGFLKNDVGLNRCSILGNINDSDGVDIEMHHFPLSLYDICWAISGRQRQEQGRFSSCTIADEALGIHYHWQVGIVPLSKTPHELHHSGTIPLSLDMVWGRWQEFFDQYRQYQTMSCTRKIEAAKMLDANRVAEIASQVIYGNKK